MGFSSYDDILTKTITNGKTFDVSFIKVSAGVPEAAGNWQALRYEPGLPSPIGTDPAATPGTAYTNMSGTGSIIFPPTSPLTKHLLSFGAQANLNCTLMLYDMLVGVSGISLTTGGVKIVNSIALPRYTDGVGVQAWMEITTATATAAPQVGLHQYTNELGQTLRSGSVVTLPAVATNQRWMGPLNLQAPDLGIRSVEQMGVSVVGTAGVTNIMLIKPLAYLPLVAGIWNERDFVLQLAALPRIYDGACLNLMELATAATATTFMGNIKVGYG